jgi:response regulator NasT
LGNIIVAFPKREDAKSIKNLLVCHGFSVNYICTSGSQVLECLDGMNDGIVISGYKLPDMLYHHLRAEMPREFEMLLVASSKYLDGGEEEGVLAVAMPLKVHELLQSVSFVEEKLARSKRRRRQIPRKRDQDGKEWIDKAKAMLMETKHMTEAEAHRYVQKSSMDSGNSMVETAQMLLRMMQ